MKKFVSFIWIASTAVCASLFALDNQAAPQPEVKAEVKEAPSIAQLSEAFGYFVGQNLQSIGVKLDFAQIVKGLQDASDGKQSPMTESECFEALNTIQEKTFKEKALENLQKAESFLQANSKVKDVKSLENGKVQYLVEKEGKGTALESHFSPLIRLTGKFLDGSALSMPKEEERVYLEELIPGLRSGLIGMKEGEKRTIYVHPELAFGTSPRFPPNALITFEVELVEVNGAVIEDEEIQTAGASESKKPSSEITTETHVR